MALEAVFSGATRHAGTASFTRDHLVAFSAHRHISVLNPLNNTTLASLAGHTDIVTGVSWLHGSDNDAEATELASCSVDGSVRVWKLARTADGRLEWTCSATLGGHKGTVHAVGGRLLAGGSALVVSAGADCTIRAWFRTPSSQDWKPLAPFALRATSIMHAVAITALPGWAPSSNMFDASSAGALIATGGVDGKVHLFTLAGSLDGPSATGRLVEGLALSGHLNWVRSLAFSHQCGTDESDAASSGEPHVMLASGSSDCKVRLWKVTLKGRTTGAHVGSLSAAALTPVSGGVARADNDGDDDDDDDDDEDRPSAEAADTVAHERGSLLSAASFLQHQAAVAAGGASNGLASLMRPKTFTASTGGAAFSFEATFDALLAGHDGWVTNVSWRHPVRIPASPASGGAASVWWQPPCVISASMDRTVTLWQPTGATTSAAAVAGAASGALETPSSAFNDSSWWSGVWEPCRRIGGAGGGGLMGLYSGQLSPDGSCVFGHSHNGALHVWVDADASDKPNGYAFASKDAAVASVQKQQWRPAAARSGHFAPATDVTWGTGGAYAVSTGLDATTRVWAPCVVLPAQSTASEAPASQQTAPWQRTWCELGRPQIHGYEMISAAVPSTPGLPHRLFTCGDEKVIRVFDAPRHFVSGLASLAGPVLASEGRAASFNGGVDGSGPADELAPRRAAFAYVSELALTNKAVAPEAAAQPIADRLQIDGKDAVQMGYDSSAAASREQAREGGGRGKGGASSGDAGEDGEAGALPAVATQAAGGSSAPPPAAGAALPPVSSAEPVTAPYLARPGPSPLDAATSSSSPLQPPPLEDDLVTHTRWPEADKLFGHPHEVVTLSGNPAGTIVASSSKARTGVDAGLRLWDALTCAPLQVLEGHKLTPIALAWSHPPRGVLPVPASVTLPQGLAGLASGSTGLHWAVDLATVPTSQRPADCESDFLVSVGKDRQVALFGRVVDDSSGAPDAQPSSALASLPHALSSAHRPPPRYQLLATFSAHKRIVWAVSWAPLPLAHSLLQDDVGNAGDTGAVALFATGARDQAVKLWAVSRRPAAEVDAAAAASAAAKPAGPGADGDDEDGGAASAPGSAADRALASSSPAVLSGGASPGGSDDALTASAATRLTLSPALTLPPFESAVTAVAFAPVSHVNDGAATCWLAVGLESGAISLWRVTGALSAASGWAWNASQERSLPSEVCPVAAVKKLAWRPPAAGCSSVDCLLAVASEDHTIRFLRVDLG